MHDEMKPPFHAPERTGLSWSAMLRANRVELWAIAAGLSCLLAAPLHAAAMSCSIVSTAHVIFGDYDTRDDDALDTAGSISYECRDVDPADRITITIGRSDHAAFFPRMMAHRAGRLEYNLYVDAARTRVWGDGTSSTSVYSVRPPEQQTVSVPIFARMSARQNVAVGNYTDSITVTVLF